MLARPTHNTAVMSGETGRLVWAAWWWPEPWCPNVHTFQPPETMTTSSSMGKGIGQGCGQGWLPAGFDMRGFWVTAEGPVKSQPSVKVESLLSLWSHGTVTTIGEIPHHCLGGQRRMEPGLRAPLEAGKGKETNSPPLHPLPPLPLQPPEGSQLSWHLEVKWHPL